MNITKENAYPVGTKIIYPDGMVRTLRTISKFPDGSDFHEWEITFPKPETQRAKTMVDSHKARIWLAKTCAGIKALARELETANVDDAFSLVYELRGKLWYEAEEFKGQL
jgi:hypothetical protein